MMFSPVPDKLSVMTYVFQMKTHFSRTSALPPSPLSLLSSSAPRKLPPAPPQVTAPATYEEPKHGDADDGTDIVDKVGGAETAAEDSTEGYNPFLEDDEENEADSTPEITADPSDISLVVSKERKSSREQEVVRKSSSASEEDKKTVQESGGKGNDVLVKSHMKPPPKPPRLHEITNSSPKVDASSKTTDTVNKKQDKNESEGYNPFDEDENEEVVDSKETVPSSKTTKPSKAYNPFDDDEDDVGDDDSQEKKLNDKEAKQGYNPFDDDDDETEDVTQTSKNADQYVGKKSAGVVKRRVSYPHDFNPFEEEDDIQSGEPDESSRKTESRDGKVDKEALSASTKSYNPFDDDDDNDDENLSGDVEAMDTSQADSSVRKLSTESKAKVSKATEAGKASPTGLAALAKPTVSLPLIVAVLARL